jgi:hypothetical protein
MQATISPLTTYALFLCILNAFDRTDPLGLGGGRLDRNSGSYGRIGGFAAGTYSAPLQPGHDTVAGPSTLVIEVNLG